MTQLAIVRGEVSYRAGDGMLLPVPEGQVGLEIADDSVIVSWEGAKGVAMSTAITRDEYDRYQREGKIRVKGE
jgi:hypothetical protein